MYTITLADGTQLKGLELNGNNYIASGIIKDSVFENNLSNIIISDGTTTETYEDMMLVHNTVYDKGTSWFTLAEKPLQEKEKEAFKVAIEEMGNLLDNILIEQLSEKGLILHE